MNHALDAQVESATRSGDVPALTRLGLQLLGGEDERFDPLRGAQLLETAARLGGADAATRMAVLCGAGVCRAQDWAEALDYLQLAAERVPRAHRRNSSCCAPARTGRRLRTTPGIAARMPGAGSARP